MLVTDQPHEYLFKKHDRLFTQPLAAGNSDKQHRERAAGWPLPPSLRYGATSQFRYRGGHHPPRVPELWTLGVKIRSSNNTQRKKNI
jgi:hypothetical protein